MDAEAKAKAKAKAKAEATYCELPYQGNSQLRCLSIFRLLFRKVLRPEKH
jgi:hypothetical protein